MLTSDEMTPANAAAPLTLCGTHALKWYFSEYHVWTVLMLLPVSTKWYLQDGTNGCKL